MLINSDISTHPQSLYGFAVQIAEQVNAYRSRSDDTPLHLASVMVLIDEAYSLLAGRNLARNGNINPQLLLPMCIKVQKANHSFCQTDDGCTVFVGNTCPLLTHRDKPAVADIYTADMQEPISILDSPADVAAMRRSRYGATGIFGYWLKHSIYLSAPSGTSLQNITLLGVPASLHPENCQDCIDIYRTPLNIKSDWFSLIRRQVLSDLGVGLQVSAANASIPDPDPNNNTNER